MKKLLFVVLAFLTLSINAQTFKMSSWHNSEIKPIPANTKSLNNFYSGCVEQPVIGQEYDADMFVPAVEVSGWQIGIANNEISFYPVSIGVDYLYVNARGKLTENGFEVTRNKFCFGVTLSNQLKLVQQSVESGTAFTLSNNAFAGGLCVGTGNGLLSVGYSTNKEIAVKLSWKLSIPNTPLSRLVCLHN